MTLEVAMICLEKLVSVSIFLQSLELLQLRQTYSKNGIWNWKTIAPDFLVFPPPIRSFLDLLFRSHPFLTVVILRSLCSLLLIPFSHVGLIGVLLISTFLISLRWRGTFNGGSDHLTLLILLCLFLSRSFPAIPGVQKASLLYLAVQVCLSYFIAGLAKIKRRNWKIGLALQGFLQNSIYQPRPEIQSASTNPYITKITSWVLMIFEISFPLALIQPQLCIIYISIASIFHLLNFYTLGLNRFLFIWLSAYPSLIWSSQFIYR